MKNLVLSALSILLMAHAADAKPRYPMRRSTKWQRPQVLCAEEEIKYFDGTTNEAHQYLKTHSEKETKIKYGLRHAMGVSKEDFSERVKIVYQAANEVDMPPQILMGVLIIESSFNELGIEEDGGNYSCGMAQLNLSEWCTWVTQTTLSEQKKMNWPIDESRRFLEKYPMDLENFCEHPIMDPQATVPFLRLLEAQDLDIDDPRTFALFRGLRFEEVEQALPVVSAEEKRLQFEATKSYLLSCIDFHHSIFALAHALRHIYDRAIPSELKKAERYAHRGQFKRRCNFAATTNTYPLQTAWLLSAAIYNAGEVLVRAIEKYKEKPWSALHPDDLVSLLYSIPKKEIFTKTHYDWWVVNTYVREIINFATPPWRPLVEPLDTADKSL